MLRKCTGCADKSRYDPETMMRTPGGWFHSPECCYDHIARKQAKAREKAARKQKAAVKAEDKVARIKHRADKKRVNRSPRAEALLAAQLLSRVSAADDDGYCQCRSCPAVLKWDEMDGGHFIAKGDSSHWSLDPRNIWPQCKPCNSYGMKYGTAEITYTLWMVSEHGQAFVDHMIATKKEVTKRNAAFYDDFIDKAEVEIAGHKKRIGA